MVVIRFSEQWRSLVSLKKTFATFAFVTAAFLVMLTAGNSRVFAQERRWEDLGGWLSIHIERQQEFEGYRDGVNVGRSDAYAHRPSSPRDSKWFRDGNEEYRDGFRRGYDEGYSRAAQRLAERTEIHQEEDGFQDGLNCGRSDALSRRPSAAEASRYFRDANGEYREGFRRGYASGYRQGQQRLAAINDAHLEQDGFQDGLTTGRSDALAHQPSNPEESRYFRDGGREYREGFRRGYLDGYHEGQQRLAAKSELRLEKDGYQDGINCGRRDALAYRQPNPGSSKAFRDGNKEYQEGFQRGYAEGYRDGLRSLER
jgi:flagellar biosynthesis/type III secretory pathway protein FliH